jgi:membrane-associated phospholipid phosphatase
MLCRESLALTTTLRPTATAARRGLRNRLIAVAALALLVGLPAAYYLAVRTHGGQVFENAALAGARQHRSGTWYEDADRWLNRITAESFGLSLVVIAAVGVVRRRWMLAVCGVATAGGTVLAARVLKHSLPVRPNLDLAGGAFDALNTFPSGHAAAAMGLFFGMLIVISRRWYVPATLLGLPGAVGSGVATVAADWHRLSDTVGADCVALAAGAAGLGLIAQLGLVGPTVRRASGPQRWLVGGMTVLTTVALAAGATYYLRYRAAPFGGAADRDAYWSSQALALGFALGAATVMLGVCLAVEAVPRRAMSLK